MFKKIVTLLLRPKLCNETWLEREFAKRGSWVTQFIINGKSYGGSYRVWEDIRPKQFFECFPDVKTILDLGSLEGGQTFQLAQHPGVQVLGIEGRQDNLKRAMFVQWLLGVKNVRFVPGNLEAIDLTQFGRFDAVFNSGVLYHLPEPWRLMEQISKITSKLFIWTHFASDEKANKDIHGYRGWCYPEGGTKDPLAGLSPKSFWLTMESLKEMLEKYDFRFITWLKIDMEHQNGPCVTLAASKDEFARTNIL